MKTDMQTLIDGINDLLAIRCPEENCAQVAHWNELRQASLNCMIMKLEQTPFTTVTEYAMPDEPIFALGDGSVETM